MTRACILVEELSSGKGDPPAVVATLHADAGEAMRQPWPPECRYRYITEVPCQDAAEARSGAAGAPGHADLEQLGPREPWTGVPAVPATAPGAVGSQLSASSGLR